MLPYGRHTLESDDWQAVYRVLQGDWLTTGPIVEQFEAEFAVATASGEAVAVSSGTAALHAAMYAAGIEPGDEVIVPALTFVATANAAVYLGATPVFADIDAETLLVDPLDVARKITPRTRAIVAVDYAGQPCDYAALRDLADQHGLALIADACHSLGASFGGQPVGALADLNCFSFHPVKPITSAEGGMVTTKSSDWAAAIRRFRNHGIDSTARQRQFERVHHYDMADLGFNYRMNELQAALGLSQLKKLTRFTRRRHWLASIYDERLGPMAYVEPLARMPDRSHSFHLYVVRWREKLAGYTRDQVFQHLQGMGIGANVHYPPVYRHSFYRRQRGAADHACPHAEQAYTEILSLPLFPSMTRAELNRVVDGLAIDTMGQLRAA
ncbi:MAG TPA: UDP-4-amino-4,6-dideoxy-N-acetyl-beta-L-altrosamine transaminase [Pirellulaceae bacterium]|nr:UDP-4-amino-4,6-dideoxy-N-acetyl-beta-L-altrosamine transaminase [Pirellulaceae bacterium]